MPITVNLAHRPFVRSASHTTIHRVLFGLKIIRNLNRYIALRTNLSFFIKSLLQILSYQIYPTQLSFVVCGHSTQSRNLGFFLCLYQYKIKMTLPETGRVKISKCPSAIRQATKQPRPPCERQGNESKQAKRRSTNRGQGYARHCRTTVQEHAD